ncbi:MAG: PEGA domain-containing protein [Caldiserica bacterium]|jgi:Tol biopolymer transport system component|nr:PEGA domain-containing protein [Caldisericota bacterium]MDH7561889.1 PEGA domain-containing protein [Caldisericota bacterium]
MRRGCPSLKLINAYLDGELSPEKERRVSEHLSSCQKCRERVESLKSIKGLLTLLPSGKRSPAFWETFESRLKERVGSRKPIFAFPSWAFRYAVVALAIVFLSLGIVSGNVSPIQLEILANVPGSSVYIDGELKGLTPLKLNVPSGFHSISLHKEGYQPWEHVFLASTLSPMKMEIKLLPRAFTDSPKEIRQFAYLSISPDGKNLSLLGSRRNFQPGSGELWLFNFEKGNLLKVVEGVAFVRPAWSPDAKKLAYVSFYPQGDVLTILNLETGVSLTGPSGVGLSQVAWIDRDRLAFISGELPSIQIFDPVNQKLIQIPTSPVERFSPSPDGSWIAYNSAVDGKVYLLSLLTQVSQELPLTGKEYLGISWSYDSKFLGISSKSGTFIWDFSGEKEIPISPDESLDICWSPEGRLFSIFEKEGVYRIESFNLETVESTILVEDSHPIESLVVSPDSSFLLFSSNDTGFFRVLKKGLTSAADSPSPLLPGCNLSLSSDPQAAEIYLQGKFLGRTPTTLQSLKAGSYELTLKKEGFSSWVLDLNLSDGEFKEVKAVLLKSGSPEPLTKTEGVKREAVVSPGGEWLAYSEGPEEDSSLYLFNLHSRSLNYLGSGRQPSWSPDGERLFFTRGFSYSDIWVYDLRDGSFNQLTFGGGAQSPAPSPSGGWIAYLSGLSPQNLSLWLMNEDGSGQRPLVQDEGPIFKFSWSPDGQRINFLVHKSGLDHSYITDLEGNAFSIFSSARVSLSSWDEEGKFLALLSLGESEREIRIYNASNFDLFMTQRTGQAEFSIFWRSGKIHWAQKEGEQTVIYGMDLEEGQPEVVWSKTGVFLLNYAEPLKGLLYSSSGNGYSQIYLSPFQAP